MSAVLYKVLIYEVGDFFLPHRDTEKEKGMFATLIVQLPSRFSGGELVVRHNGSERVYSSSDQAEFGVRFAAHCADVEHEVKPVTSGRRVAVIYNLVWTGAHAPSVQNVRTVCTGIGLGVSMRLCVLAGVVRCVSR